MGQVSGKALIIEFNGTPGAGKTTTAIEVKKRLRDMKIRTISLRRVMRYQRSYKEIMASKEIRRVYIIFLKAFLLIRPITWERLKYMNTKFNYWLGIKKLCISKNHRNGICILDQGIIQGFVSMAYLGKIRNEKKYYQYIRQVMDTLDNVICVNCSVEADISMTRMRVRKPNGGRLYQVNNNKELKEILELQKKQFEEIRRIAIKDAVTIDMNNSVEDNAKKIIEYYMTNFQYYDN